MSVCLSLPSSIPTLRMKEEEEEEEEEADGDRISGSALLPAGKSVSGPPFLPPAAASDHPGFFRAKLWTTSIIRGGREEGTRSRGQGTDRGKVPSSKLGQSTD